MMAQRSTELTAVPRQKRKIIRGPFCFAKSANISMFALTGVGEFAFGDQVQTDLTRKSLKYIAAYEISQFKSIGCDV